MSSVPAFPLTTAMKQAAKRLEQTARASGVVGEHQEMDAEDAFRLFLGMRSCTVNYARVLGVSVERFEYWKEKYQRWRQVHAPAR